MVSFIEGMVIDDFCIQFPIKINNAQSTYKVAGCDGTPFFMKIYDVMAFPPNVRPDGEMAQISAMRDFHVKGYVKDGSFTFQEREYAYIVTEYYAGQLLSERLRGGKSIEIGTAFRIASSIVSQLSELDYSHNDICPSNIILVPLEESSSEDLFRVEIIDWEHAYRNDDKKYPYFYYDMDPRYCATEVADGIFSKTADVYAVCALYFRMVTGVHPWDYPEHEPVDSLRYFVRNCRGSYSRNANLEDFDTSGFAQTVVDVLYPYDDSSSRPSLHELNELMINTEKEVPERYHSMSFLNNSAVVDYARAYTRAYSPGKSGCGHAENSAIWQRDKGFKAIAGMDELKADLTNRIIWVLKDKEKAKRYKITPPNGMLLYGPPGCGKTFFAEKFAEETGYNFKIVKGSDLASTSLHGTQSKIGELFDQARKDAPSIICFDEFDAFVPRRTSSEGEAKGDEVNEFLTQMNECHKDGLFIIGTTNMKELIDPAVLRKGRMDLHVEIKAPDLACRKELFRLGLYYRPVSEDVAIHELAIMTENYSAADIRFIINEAALMAALGDVSIGQEHLKNAIRHNSPSIPQPQQRPRIGF